MKSGDFNHLNIVRNQFKLKQLVKFHTRGSATLDLILTNMEVHFSKPECFPSFGLSDHNTIILKPKSRVPNQNTQKSVTFRDMKEGKSWSVPRQN